MVGFMNEEAFRKTVETGYVTFFSRSRNKLWLKGEIVRPSAGGQGNLDRLRSRRAAHPGGSARPRRLPRRLPELLLPPARRRANGKNPSRAPTIRTRSTGANRETEARHSQRQPRKRDHRSVSPRRLQHHHQLAFLFSRHRRSRNRMHDDPRAGNGALRRRRRAGRRTHRPRLDRRERSQGARRRRSDLRQAELRQSALGAGGARSVAVPEREGSGRQDHRHRIGRHHRALSREERRARPKSNSVGAPPK